MRVDYFNNREDFQVVMLGSLGFSTTFIQQFTGLTFSQVLYRLHKVGTKRSDYREGRSQLALSMVKRNETVIEQTVSRQIRKELKLRQLEEQHVA
jgi:hypothetical protein